MIIVPLLPAIGNAVNPSGVHISSGLSHLYDFNWLYCFFSSSVLYYALNWAWPHTTTLIPAPVYAEHTVRRDGGDSATVVSIEGIEKGNADYAAGDVDHEHVQMK